MGWPVFDEANTENSVQSNRINSRNIFVNGHQIRCNTNKDGTFPTLFLYFFFYRIPYFLVISVSNKHVLAPLKYPHSTLKKRSIFFITSKWFLKV